MKYLILLLSVTTILASEEAVQEFVGANNLFTATVYKELLKENKTNLLVSPFSAETVLALTQSGGKGQTVEELRNALRLPNSKEKIEYGVKEILQKLKGNEEYSLHTANKMYLQQNFPIKDEFKNVAKEIYQSDIENINFSERDEAAKTMNTWVEEHTANKIKNLIDPSNLNSETVAILINALYFKGEWNTKFYEHSTQKKPFYKTATEMVQVNTMHHYNENFQYYESSELNAKFLEMSFKGGDVSMTFILPNEKDGLASLENQIEKLFTPQPLQTELVNVALPKFKIESKIDFKQILKNLGVKKLFDADQADLSGIADLKYKLHVSDVIQKTFIDVEEGGVEAAAATYVSVVRGMSSMDYVKTPEPKEFIADHPFIFYLKANGVIIFTGRVVAP